MTYLKHVYRVLIISEVRPKLRDNRKGPQIRPNRMKVNDNIPSEEELLAIKHKKKVGNFNDPLTFNTYIYLEPITNQIYETSKEQVNSKPSRHGLDTFRLK